MNNFIQITKATFRNIVENDFVRRYVKNVIGFVSALFSMLLSLLRVGLICLVMFLVSGMFGGAVMLVASGYIFSGTGLLLTLFFSLVGGFTYFFNGDDE